MIEWTPEMLQALIELRKAGQTIKYCAEIIGVNHELCRQKAIELGLNQRNNTGRRPGTDKRPPFNKQAYNRAYHKARYYGL